MRVCGLAPAGVDTPIYRTAANYLRREGRPPPPVSSPERVAAAALDLAERPRRMRQIGPANRLIEFGYLALPGVYDRLVTPLYKVLVAKPGTVAPPGPGNAFAPPADEAHQLRR